MCNPKRQAVFDRLKKRMNTYRKRQVDTVPRFDQTFTGICEQQSIETNVLQKRFIETKAKRVAKKADKKQTDTAPTGNLVSYDVDFISLLITERGRERLKVEKVENKIMIKSRLYCWCVVIVFIAMIWEIYGTL